jgi:hypothetical protein
MTMDYKRIYEDIMNSDSKIRLVIICNASGEIMHSNHREKAYKIYFHRKKVKNHLN